MERKKSPKKRQKRSRKNFFPKFFIKRVICSPEFYTTNFQKSELFSQFENFLKNSKFVTFVCFIKKEKLPKIFIKIQPRLNFLSSNFLIFVVNLLLQIL